MEPLKFEVGQRVRVTTQKYGLDQFGREGTIIRRGEGINWRWFWIRCDDKYENCYLPEDVVGVNGPW